jgi:hypothetical protein
MRQSPVNRSSALLTVGSAVQTLEPEAIRFAVSGRWVPGTLDRVLLERQDATGSLEVHHNRVHQLFGRGAMDPLYLTGKSKFECTLEEWAALNV